MITPRTRAFLLNTPHNPTADASEIQAVIDLVLKYNLILITDEIYDRILYDGRVHQSPVASKHCASVQSPAAALAKPLQSPAGVWG